MRNAYPEGIVPGCDYPALLAVLGGYMPVEDVVRVAAEFIVRGTNPLSGVDLRRAHLRSTEWTLGNTG